MDGLTNTTTTATPSLAEILFLEASQSFPALLSQFSASVLLIWEIIITLDQEVELIWRARNCVVKYLFLFIRYIALSQVIVTITLLLGDFKTGHNICQLYAWYYTCSSILLLIGVDVLLVYRAFAFYGRDRRVLIGLVILWALNSGATLVLSFLISISFPISHSTALFISGVIGECEATSFPRLLHDIWISELIFQSILFLLVLGRFIKLAISSWNKTGIISTLYLVFIRDGIWAYLLLFGLFVACVLRNELAGLSLIQWALVFTEITASRLILNLRSLYTTPRTEVSSGEWLITPFLKWAGKGVLFDTIYETESDISLSRVHPRDPNSSENAIELRVIR